WSPAWTYIAFQSNRGGNWDIFTIRAGCDVATLGEEACGLRQLTDDPADDMLPAWSPDGRHIAFVSTRDGGADLFFVTLDDGSVQRVTNDPAGAWRPAWLPDSRHLLFTSARSGNNDLYAVR
ncbi:MAG: PD40 domain-containing protein, partial [Caldilinea sp.]|nr:PD40 domain-containing protein [Caldilinea sp.]